MYCGFYSGCISDFYNFFIIIDVSCIYFLFPTTFKSLEYVSKPCRLCRLKIMLLYLFVLNFYSRGPPAMVIECSQPASQHLSAEQEEIIRQHKGTNALDRCSSLGGTWFLNARNNTAVHHNGGQQFHFPSTPAPAKIAIDMVI